MIGKSETLEDILQCLDILIKRTTGIKWEEMQRQHDLLCATRKRVVAAEALHKALISASDVISKGEYPVTFMDVQDGFRAWEEATK
jgi:hypothetical protein